jgi:RimJ/RimL family protein N-acetyltransferase
LFYTLDALEGKMNESLFESARVRLAPPDADKDAAIESGWTHDLDFQRRIGASPARPLSPGQIKKKYEALEKDGDKQYYFAARTREPDGPGRLLGFARLFWVDLVHGNAILSVGIGSPADRGQGYGTELMGLMLNYAFNELGLHRLSAMATEDNPEAIRFVERHSFQLEVRRRQAVVRDNRHWDMLLYGLLRSEWAALRRTREAGNGK